ncbi:hypothetical protein N7488_005114 [Penicillium malachiteum]|nr:hypothetical protein N7488_005114 [Penicillium malachiteum]
MIAHYWLASPLHHQLSFFHLKLVMREFYYGPKAGISSDCLSYLKVKDFSRRCRRDDVIWLCSQDAQICDNPPGLYIRLQDVLLFGKREDLLVDLSNTPPSYFPITSNVKVCLHKRSFNTIFPLIRSFHEKEETHIAHDITCKICNTEAHIEIAEMGSKIALVVTKWVNLDPGITPDDILWRAHVDNYRVRDNISECIPEHLYTNPRVCFERVASHSFKDLGSHNLAILKEREYLTSSSFRRSPWTKNM